MQQQPQFPPLNLSLDLPAVNMLLRGLGKLPIEEAGDLYHALRAAAQKHVAETQAADEASAAAAADSKA